MLRRSGVIVLMVVATGLLAGRPAETHVSRSALDTLPLRMDDWQGRDAQPLPDDVTAQLGVDDYVNRVYVEVSGAPVGVYPMTSPLSASTTPNPPATTTRH